MPIVRIVTFAGRWQSTSEPAIWRSFEDQELYFFGLKGTATGSKSYREAGTS
jgi:hypothetical protein